MKDKKDNLVMVYLNDKEKKMLDEIIEYDGATKSGYFSRQLRDDYRNRKNNTAINLTQKN